MATFTAEDAAAAALHLAAETLAKLQTKGILSRAEANEIIDATRGHVAATIGQVKANELLDTLYRLKS